MSTLWCGDEEMENTAPFHLEFTLAVGLLQ